MWQDDRLWAGLALAVGLLQAWDSGGFAVGLGVAVLAALGVILPAATILATRAQEARMAALVLGLALLTWARIASPVSLNGLHLSLFVPAVYVLLLPGLLARSPRQHT
jgi:hypothetical protein